MPKTPTNIPVARVLLEALHEAGAVVRLTLADFSPGVAAHRNNIRFVAEFPCGGEIVFRCGRKTAIFHLVCERERTPDGGPNVQLLSKYKVPHVLSNMQTRLLMMP